MASVYKSLSKGANANGAKNEAATGGAKKNKQRVLMLSSRGITYRHRHLLNDLSSLMPHGKKDAKFDTKSKLQNLCELAELYSCNNVLYFEARKSQDLYVWMSKVPNGPTVKMHLQNLHTMEELHFTGNCLKGSRPILSFDAAFDDAPHLQLLKELLLHIFGVPPESRRMKPFIDHVMGFSYLDGRVWIRNYQINEVADASKETDVSLVEIGPRFCLTPIIIQEGSFGGPIIYENKMFVSPNQVRADLRRRKASKHSRRTNQQTKALAKKGDLGLRTKGGKDAPVDELDWKRL